MPRNPEPKRFSPSEKAKLVLIFERKGRDREKFRLAARSEMNLRDWNLPTTKTLKNWIQQLEETGSLERRSYSRERYKPKSACYRERLWTICIKAGAK